MSSLFSFARHLVIQDLERPTSRCVVLHVKCSDRSSLRRMHKMSSPQRKVCFLLLWQCSSTVKIVFSPINPSCIARSTKINQSRHGQPSLQTCHSLQTSATYQKEGKMKTSNAASWIFAPQLLLPTTFQVKHCLVCPPLFLNMLPRSPNSGGGFALWWIVFAVDSKKQLLVLLPSCWISSHC